MLLVRNLFLSPSNIEQMITQMWRGSCQSSKVQKWSAYKSNEKLCMICRKSQARQTPRSADRMKAGFISLSQFHHKNLLTGSARVQSVSLTVFTQNLLTKTWHDDSILLLGDCRTEECKTPFLFSTLLGQILNLFVISILCFVEIVLLFPRLASNWLFVM